jgi:hypothetical protein
MNMFRRGLPIATFFIGAFLSTVFQPFSPFQSLAQPGCQTFRETNKAVCGRFLDYWQKNGGLPQQGFPISSPFTEVSELNGKPYTVQYFERAVFEYHPENQPPNDVLLSQLGTFQFKRKYPNGEPTTGGPVTTVTPATPATGSTPVSTTQAGTMVGQVVEGTGAAGQKFRITVQSVEETQKIDGPGGVIFPTAGKLVLVYVSLTNLGQQSDACCRDGFRLVDDKERRYFLMSRDKHRAAEEDLHRDSIYEYRVAPQSSAVVFLLFDIAKDANNYRLVLTPPAGQ